MKKKERFINRELSWLSFNARVLQEADDPDVPLLERLRFLGIFSNNLDEFYRVRVATHQRMIAAGIKSKKIGHPKKVLQQIQKRVVRLRERFDKVFSQVLRELQKENIYILNEKELDEKQTLAVLRYFQEKVRPRLVPIMLSSQPGFPYLKNQVIYLAVHMWRSGKSEKEGYALIEVPSGLLPRFIPLPSGGLKKCIIMLDDVIRIGLGDIFAILEYDRFAAYTIKMTRDAEFDISEDITKSFYEKIAKSIKQREKGAIVRFVYDREMPEALLEFIMKRIKMTSRENLISGGRYHNARDFIGFPDMGLKHLTYTPVEALPHPAIKPRKSIFDSIRQKDILLCYPYQSYSPVIDFLREAAIDPKVKSIKITLYRVAKNSSVINALINARRNGKDVTAVFELQARFDEEANIHWASELANEGAHILDGVPGLKVHAKLCQVTRVENEKEKLYSYISTGNFNEATAGIYSDHGLFTAHRQINNEVSKVFSFLENNYKTTTYKHLLVSPFFMRNRLKKLIKNEIKNAQAGERAEIILKLNNLVDTGMINLLYSASQAGVSIKLLIRGICSLIPGVEGMSENIEAFAIVDKYLEHSRILYFYAGGQNLMFLSSADWMIRNLDNRIEVATPVYDPDIKDELRTYLSFQLRDNQKTRLLNDQEANYYKQEQREKAHRAQVEYYNYLATQMKDE
ncbi:MAG TPA: polyphosphate kinase 1 [Caldithrix abyssi]|uniref:Polyphosphate kinase n=1 Tax=Caldithrix abyssi TaxID=187145 RepID=A0A7V5RPT8_CALAY|nr:polyphosphate kinase 1 [Caldithrix abyssi]